MDSITEKCQRTATANRERMRCECGCLLSCHSDILVHHPCLFCPCDEFESLYLTRPGDGDPNGLLRREMNLRAQGNDPYGIMLGGSWSWLPYIGALLMLIYVIAETQS